MAKKYVYEQAYKTTDIFDMNIPKEKANKRGDLFVNCDLKMRMDPNG